MGFDEGQIIFDHEDLTYHAGEVVHGKVVFNQEKNKTFRGMYVKMKGYCDVHWTTRHTRRVNDRDEHYTVEHTSHETYFEQKIYLMGGPSGEVLLHPGFHEFPFQCLIPPHVPSSFEGSDGHIRYEVKVIVDRSIKFDQEKKAQLRVINQKDLNMDPYCKEVMELEFDETYCCWCMSQGNCEIHTKLPQSGYCPGQTINIELSCANNSNVEMNGIKFELIEHREYIATHNPEKRHEKNVLASLKKGSIPGNTTRNWTLEMEIPHMDLYNLTCCQYIDIRHEFKVTVIPSGCHSETEGSRRIVLGHIPLREFEGSSGNRGDQVVSQPLAPSMTQLPGTHPFPTQHPTAPLPTGPYQETNPSYPGANSPFPNAGTNPPYPTGNQFNSNAHPPYPETNSLFPGTNPPYPGTNPSNTGINPPYPGTNSPRLGANPPYPGANPSNTGINPPYPGTNSPFLGANPSNTGVNPPYPGTNSPFPGANPPYPVANPSNTGVNPRYPNEPNSGAFPPYASPLPGVSPYPVGTNPSPAQPGFAATDSSTPRMNADPYSSNTPAVTSFAASAPPPSTPDLNGCSDSDTKWKNGAFVYKSKSQRKIPTPNDFYRYNCQEIKRLAMPLLKNLKNVNMNCLKNCLFESLKHRKQNGRCDFKKKNKVQVAFQSQNQSCPKDGLKLPRKNHVCGRHNFRHRRTIPIQSPMATRRNRKPFLACLRKK